MNVRRIVLLLAVVFALAPSTAGAQNVFEAPVQDPPTLDTVPPGFTTTGRDALRIATAQPKVGAWVRDHPGLEAQPQLFGLDHWQVDFLKDGSPQIEVEISPDGRVEEVWTGIQAASYVARTDSFDIVSSPWVIGAFSLLLLAPFVSLRERRRLLHLDLLMLSAFTGAFALLAVKQVAGGLWLIYAALAYLLGRTLWCGLRPRTRPRGHLVPMLPTAVLAIGLVALIGARVTINVKSSEVIDVGLTSVIGADRVSHGEELYADNDAHGDTYGPLNYVAYVPFEQALPYKGKWDRVPAAHAAAITFDLLTILGLVLLGYRRRRGRAGLRLGLALGWAWAAMPMTMFTLAQSSNDGLIAMLAVWTLVAFSRPAARGVLLGLAASAKLFPAALIGALWRGDAERGVRERIVAASACVGVLALSVFVYLPDGGLREFWNCTLGFQLSRAPDLSLWAQYTGTGAIQHAVVGLALLLGLAVGFLPRGARTMPQAAGLSAAVTIALQMGGGHWYFFYVVWFLPGLLVAIFDEHDTAGDVTAPAEPVVRRELVAA